MLVFGGNIDTFRNVFEYNFVKENWNHFAINITHADYSKCTDLRGHSALIMNDILYVYGGAGNNAFKNSKLE